MGVWWLCAETTTSLAGTSLSFPLWFCKLSVLSLLNYWPRLTEALKHPHDMKRRAYLHLDHHLGVDIGLTNNIAKFFKINFPFVFLEIQLSTCFKQKKSPPCHSSEWSCPLSAAAGCPSGCSPPSSSTPGRALHWIWTRHCPCRRSLTEIYQYITDICDISAVSMLLSLDIATTKFHIFCLFKSNQHPFYSLCQYWPGCVYSVSP